MGIGLGIVLLVVGLILLTGAVELPDAVTDSIESYTVGWICILAGVLALVMALMVSRNRNRTETRVERREM